MTKMTEMEEWKKLLEICIGKLAGALEKMRQDLSPSVPLPRPRHVNIAPGVTWPEVCNGYLNWDAMTGGVQSLTYMTRYAADVILRACRYQPRLVLRAIRRIETATAWCLARAEGRKRAAQEILRQQARAVETLEAMAAMRHLAEGKPH